MNTTERAYVIENIKEALKECQDMELLYLISSLLSVNKEE